MLTNQTFTEEQIEQWRFPHGPMPNPDSVSKPELVQFIIEIGLFPSQVRDLTEGLSKEQLEFRYRPDGWCIRQIVHHCADSHMNSIIRYKLALTEDNPEIRPYFEDRWAELADVEQSIETSLTILGGLHARWVTLLKSIKDDDWGRVYIHPEYKTTFRLDAATAAYAWHCRHHHRHMELALENQF